MPRLCQATLPPHVPGPRYDREAVRTGIVHLGLGAFHRAHQAVYTEAVLQDGDRQWGIAGASLRSAATRDALAPQDGLYTLNVQSEVSRYAVIGALRQQFVAPENPAALVAAMADPGVKIVSLTITEKGYCRDAATGGLDAGHPDIVHDLVNQGAPRSALGFLTAALAARRAAGVAPFTILCCDNLPENGAALRQVLVAFAGRVAPDLGAWIADRVACPSTMVDRIVPATTDADRARIAAATGVEDAWPVVCEPFTQWVIEDHFPLGRPDWSVAGAQFVQDVAPFEAMKLRLLNASHSGLAYLGYLAGHETVADTMAAPGFAAFAARLMADAAPTLDVPAGTDIPGYAASLLERFRNPALRHRTWQIAMDGTQKLPQRLLETVRARLARKLPIGPHALAVAAWMRYATGVDEHGAAIDVRDPLAGELAQRTAEAGPVPERIAAALLGMRAVFGADLPADARFRTAVTEALAGLYANGAGRTVAQMS